MWIAEQVLFQFARALYRTEIAHSSEMKNAIKNIDAFDEYRAAEIARIVEAAERHGISIAGQTILDFGCSDGALSREYLRRGAAKVIGVDMDERAIRRAVEVHRAERLVFVTNTVDAIPLDDRSVDLVISYDVFEHVAKPGAILKELHRILTPNGKVLIGTWSWFHPFAPHLFAVMPVPWAQVSFSEKTVLKVCQRVYHSSWYTPNMHDFDENGKRLPDRYTNRSISTDYLNKFLIKDFERAFTAAGFRCQTHAVPFASRYARWTGVFLHVPWVREFVAGYVWFELSKSVDEPRVLNKV